ncbi:polysaccharide deacetylase family protein [Aeoliella mucimassa]|nr:polysaccharide deacetylase family protein [Aeoliella mucimassa]
MARRWLLNTYYTVSTPVRWTMEQVRRYRRHEPVQVVFYHRVADDVPNPWTISTQSFAEQIDWLSQRFDLVSMAEAQYRIERGKNRRPTAVVTFDDGYADNMNFALPLLLERKIPVTYFVSTDYIRNGKPFPHDVELGQPLAPNTVDDIRRLAEAGIEIGAHTRSHANVAELDSQQLQHEIVGSKQDLELMLGREVRYFAFPYGQPQHLSGEAFQVAQQAGFAGVCSAYGGYNFPGSDSFHLERFHGDPEFVRFKHWLSVDAMKVFRSPSFDPELTAMPQVHERQECIVGERG